MKHKLILVVLLSFIVKISQSQVLTKFSFQGSADCNAPGYGQGNNPDMTPINFTVTNLQRHSPLNTGVTPAVPFLQCYATDNMFSTSGFHSENFLEDEYIEVTLTANAGYYLNIHSIYFMASRAGTTNPPVSAKVAHDGSGSFSTEHIFPLTTTSTPTHWVGFNPFSTAVGGTVRFRIYAKTAAPGSGSYTSYLRLDDVTIFGTVTTVPTSGLWISTSAGDIYNTNPGNVGIGTSQPIAKLDVQGNIFANGKVLIGTTDLNKAGTHSLAVNGSAIFNKVKVRTYLAWPDYVFDKNYKLPTLQDVEAFIKKNKHLPGIKAANIIEKEGIDVAETQASLLTKIEELTLYLIELNKKIEKLQKEYGQLLNDKISIKNK